MGSFLWDEDFGVLAALAFLFAGRLEARTTLMRHADACELMCRRGRPHHIEHIFGGRWVLFGEEGGNLIEDEGAIGWMKEIEAVHLIGQDAELCLDGVGF